MSELTDAERAALLVPCDCGHDADAHGSVIVGCWACAEVGGACPVAFESLLHDRLAVIIADRIAARDAQWAVKIELLAALMQDVANGSAAFAAAREGLSDAGDLSDHSAAMTRWSAQLRTLPTYMKSVAP